MILCSVPPIKTVIKKRLLLAILGYDINTGLKSVSARNKNASYKDLQHMKLRYFDLDNLKSAIREIINSLLRIQAAKVWNNCTTSVASDSMHF